MANENDNKKPLPYGTWIYVRYLPVETTEESLSQLLWEKGMHCPPECISLRNHKDDHASAIISMPSETVAVLVNWALETGEGDVPLFKVQAHQSRRAA